MYVPNKNWTDKEADTTRSTASATVLEYMTPTPPSVAVCCLQSESWPPPHSNSILQWLSAAFRENPDSHHVFLQISVMQVALFEASCSWFWTVPPSYTTPHEILMGYTGPMLITVFRPGASASSVNLEMQILGSTPKLQSLLWPKSGPTSLDSVNKHFPIRDMLSSAISRFLVNSKCLSCICSAVLLKGEKCSLLIEMQNWGKKIITRVK